MRIQLLELVKQVLTDLINYTKWNRNLLFFGHTCLQKHGVIGECYIFYWKVHLVCD